MLILIQARQIRLQQTMRIFLWRRSQTKRKGSFRSSKIIHIYVGSMMRQTRLDTCHPVACQPSHLCCTIYTRKQSSYACSNLSSLCQNRFVGVARVNK